MLVPGRMAWSRSALPREIRQWFSQAAAVTPQLVLSDRSGGSSLKRNELGEKKEPCWVALAQTAGSFSRPRSECPGGEGGLGPPSPRNEAARRQASPLSQFVAFSDPRRAVPAWPLSFKCDKDGDAAGLRGCPCFLDTTRVASARGLFFLSSSAHFPLSLRNP